MGEGELFSFPSFMRTIIVFSATLFVLLTLAISIPERYGFGYPFLAQIGISVGVPENPYNNIAQQLTEKERVLSEREQRLDTEIAQAEARAQSDLDRSILVILGLLFTLILLNLWLDHRAREQLKRVQKQI